MVCLAPVGYGGVGSVCLSVYLSVCLSVCLSACLSVFHLDLLKQNVSGFPRPWGNLGDRHVSVSLHVDYILNRFLIRTLWARTAFSIDQIVRFASCGPITAVSCFPNVMDIPPNTSIMTLICLTL